MEISKICDRIKERRKELDMTQKDLADAMHVSNQLISKWETGESVPSLEYLQPLSEALQTSISALVGESEASAPVTPAPEDPVPDEPKEKAPSQGKAFWNKVKAFWKKHRKQLLISIVSVASALVILAVALLSVYVFAPSANKKRYIDKIDRGIDKYLELGYFNIKSSVETDGDEDESPDVLQGYIDENGNAVYHNSVTRVTVKDRVMTYGSGYSQKDYVQPASVVTVSDLLEEQLKTWNDGDDDFDLDDVTYIRRSGKGYYLEFSEEYFFDDFKPSEKKNIKLTDKIKGRVEMDGDITKSLETTVKFRNTVSDENFTVKSKIEFIQEKPEIEHRRYAPTAGAERVTQAELAQKLNAVSVKSSLCSEILDAIKDGRLYYDNDYLYTHTYSVFTIFDKNDFTVQHKVNLSLNGYATPYDSGIWYVRSTSSNYKLCYYDMQTKSETEKLTFDNGFSYAGNKHYFYVNRSSGGGSEVYDMERQQIIMTSQTDYVRRVDDAGNIYCYKPEDRSLYVYGTDKKLKGNKIVRKVDDYVYTQDESNEAVVYEYKSGDPVREIHLPSDFSTFNESHCWETLFATAIYDLDGNTALSLPGYMSLANADNRDTEYEPNVMLAWGEWALLCLEKSYGSNDAYLALFRLGERSSLVAYTNDFPCKSAQLFRFGDKTYLALYESSSAYSDLQDFLLLES